MCSIDNLSYTYWLTRKGVQPLRGPGSWGRSPIRWARYELLPALGIQGREGQANLEQLAELLGVNLRTVLRAEQKPHLEPFWRAAIAGALLDAGREQSPYSTTNWGDGFNAAVTWLEQTGGASS